MNVNLIIDSTTDLNPQLREQFTVVPLTVHFGDQEYIDGVTISHRQFYEKLVESDVLPSTSQATPAAFADVFEEVARRGETAVVLTLASQLSGTYQSAMIAASDYPGRIFVVDGTSVAIGTGILAELALRLREQGLTAEEIAGGGKGENPRSCPSGHPGIPEAGRQNLRHCGLRRRPALHQAGYRREGRGHPDAGQSPGLQAGQ